jgi:hypothetical protein
MRLGLFDESLVRNQDDELNLRLVRAGGKIWQNPRIVSWYSPRARLWPLFRQYFQYGFWKVAVIQKHRTPGSWRPAVPALFVLANALFISAISLTAFTGAQQWLSPMAFLWFAMMATYCVANLVASAITAKQNGWNIFPFLPAVFATYHLSYGLGFFVGLVKLLAPSNQPMATDNESYFNRVTR